MIFNIRRRATTINGRRRRKQHNNAVTTKNVIHTAQNPASKTTHKSRINKTHAGAPMFNTMKMKSNKKGGGCGCGK